MSLAAQNHLVISGARKGKRKKRRCNSTLHISASIQLKCIYFWIMFRSSSKAEKEEKRNCYPFTKWRPHFSTFRNHCGRCISFTLERLSLSNGKKCVHIIFWKGERILLPLQHIENPDLFTAALCCLTWKLIQQYCGEVLYLLFYFTCFLCYNR